MSVLIPRVNTDCFLTVMKLYRGKRQCWPCSCWLRYLLVLSYTLSYCYVQHCYHIVRVEGDLLLCFPLVCGLFTVSHGLFALSLSIIGRLCSMNVARPEHICFKCVTFNSKLYWRTMSRVHG